MKDNGVLLPYLHEGKDVGKNVRLVVDPEGREHVGDGRDRGGRQQVEQVEEGLQPQQEKIVGWELELAGASEHAETEQVEEDADDADGQHGGALHRVAEVAVAEVLSRRGVVGVVIQHSTEVPFM